MHAFIEGIEEEEVLIELLWLTCVYVMTDN